MPINQYIEWTKWSLIMWHTRVTVLHSNLCLIYNNGDTARDKSVLSKNIIRYRATNQMIFEIKTTAYAHYEDRSWTAWIGEWTEQLCPLSTSNKLLFPFRGDHGLTLECALKNCSKNKSAWNLREKRGVRVHRVKTYYLIYERSCGSGHIVI